jgi:hypothetical protein
MVGMDTMAIGGSDIAKDLLRVGRILFLWKKNLIENLLFSKWKK